MDSEMVTGPDGSLVDITTSVGELPTQGDEVPRYLGIYTGDGSQMNISAQIHKGKPTMFLLLGFCGVAVFSVIFVAALIFIWTSGLSSSSLLDSALKVSGGIGAATFAIGSLGIFILDYHYFIARLRFGANIQQARYWNGNYKLRTQCVPPRSKILFKQVIYAAQAADREKAPAYIAEQTANYFAQLIDERGLWSQKASSAWLGPIVFQGILDAQNPGADPDDEQSGASEE